MSKIDRVEIIDFEYEVKNLAAATEHTHNHVAYKKGEIAKLEAELAQLQPPPPPQAVVGNPCVSCGRPVPTGAGFCPSCGAKVEVAPTPEARFCQHCGAALRPGAKFCPNCGQSVPAP